MNFKKPPCPRCYWNVRGATDASLGACLLRSPRVPAPPPKCPFAAEAAAAASLGAPLPTGIAPPQSAAV